MPRVRHYPATSITDVCTAQDAAAADFTVPAIPNVVAQFSSLNRYGEGLAAHPAQEVKTPRYMETGDNLAGADNHFQGVQRLRVNNYAVLSGGDPHEPQSHLFVAELASREAGPAWSSNLRWSKRPNAGDRFLATFGLDATLWRAGGLSALGDVLAVPIENAVPGASRVQFFNVRDPLRPKRFAHEIDRPALKGGAVALTRLLDGRYLCAVWSDSEATGRKPKKHLDFYVSDGTDFTTVRWSDRITFFKEVEHFEPFQAIAFLWETDTTGRRTQLFLFGFQGTSSVAPLAGASVARLYPLHVPDPFPTQPTRENLSLGVGAATSRDFSCGGKVCNMAGGAGTYVGTNRRLTVHAVYPFLTPLKQGFFQDLFGGRVFAAKFVEFRATSGFPGVPISSLSASWVELCDGKDLDGACLSLIGGRDGALPDLEKAKVLGDGFGKRAVSALYQLPPTHACLLHLEERFGGAALALAGTGHIERLDELPIPFRRGVRSLRIVTLPDAQVAEPAAWFPGEP